MNPFRANPSARVRAEGGRRLWVSPPKAAPFGIDVAGLDWIAFVNVGDSFLANEDGWWLLGSGAGATAVWHGCPAVDTAMRGPLAAAADAVPNLFILHVADTPRVLRSVRRKGGVADLGADDLDRLREIAAIQPVARIDDMPVLP